MILVISNELKTSQLLLFLLQFGDKNPMALKVLTGKKGGVFT
tara:strand:- start:41 stop:166 length:126 start_codon:yes stop_codon:yes gene_type:complete